MKIGVLNIQAPVRMTPCLPRLQLQTLWIGVILTGKMTFWEDKCLIKVYHVKKIGVLNLPAPVRMPGHTLFYRSDNTKQTNDKTNHPRFIEELDI